jgi:hypothetical protein
VEQNQVSLGSIVRIDVLWADGGPLKVMDNIADLLQIVDDGAVLGVDLPHSGRHASPHLCSAPRHGPVGIVEPGVDVHRPLLHLLRQVELRIYAREAETAPVRPRRLVCVVVHDHTIVLRPPEDGDAAPLLKQALNFVVAYAPVCEVHQVEVEAVVDVHEVKAERVQNLVHDPNRVSGLARL